APGAGTNADRADNRTDNDAGRRGNGTGPCGGGRCNRRVAARKRSELVAPRLEHVYVEAPESMMRDGAHATRPRWTAGQPRQRPVAGVPGEQHPEPEALHVPVIAPEPDDGERERNQRITKKVREL